MLTLTSRVARKPINIPNGVNVTVNGSVVDIKGPKGNLQLTAHSNIDVTVKESEVTIETNNSGYNRNGSGKKLLDSLPGTTRSLINNAVLGVSEGFERKLTLVGVGYRAQMKDKVLHLSLGFSHPVEYTTPEGVTIEAPSLTEIIVKGADKQLVGHVISIIKKFRPAEPYKGKGVIDPRRPVVRKETKKK